MTVPHWRVVHDPRTIRCDTAVLGGGISGVAAALALERRGVDVVIVERGEIASGASGRNAGFLMRGAADNYAAAVRQWGRQTARMVWRWSEENLAMLRAEGIELLPSVRRMPSCLLAFEREEADELRTAYEMLREDHFDAGWQESGTDAAWRGGALAGLVNPGDAACNPCELVAYLAGRLRRPPLTNHEVARVERDGPGVLLHTAEAVIQARRCLVCLNAYAPLLFPALGPVLRPNRGQMMAVRTASRAFDMSYYANHGSEYFRQTLPGIAVFGGWRKHFAQAEIGWEDRTTPEVQQGLEEFASRLLGGKVEVASRWAGTMAFTPDGLPIIGPIDAEGRPADVTSPLWFCGGYTGHGMSMGFKCAHAAVDAMLNRADPPFPLTRFSGATGRL